MEKPWGQLDLQNTTISIKTSNKMEISHIEHIGIAVPNLEEAIKYYETVLGLKCYKQEVV